MTAPASGERRRRPHGTWGLLGVAFGALALAATALLPQTPTAHSLRIGLACSDCASGVTRIEDPIFPKHPLRVVGRRAKHGIAAPNTADDTWVSALPSQDDRVPTRAQQLSGRNPCAPRDPGEGIYTDWLPAPPIGVFVMPERMKDSAPASVDVLVHFHGHELARDALVDTHLPLVLLGITRQNGAVYRRELGGPHALDHVIAALRDALEHETGGDPAIDHVALTSWSGGYEAISVILEQSESASSRVDAVAVFDGPHTARSPRTANRQLEPFVRFARRALDGERFMFLSHSSIVPPGYASTTEADHRILHLLDKRPLGVVAPGLASRKLIEAFSQGSLHERGYAGGGKIDHCAQMRLYPDVLRALYQRWHEPARG